MNESDLKINRRFVINIVMSVFFILMVYFFLKLISPFIISIFLAVVFTVVFYPVYLFFLLRLRMGQNISSFASVFFVFIIFVFPFIFFGWLLFKEARVIYPSLVDYFSNIDLNKVNLPSFLRFSASDIKDIISYNMDQIHKTIVKSGFLLIKNIFFFFINLFVMFISMFFFFRDGKNILAYLVDVLPFSNHSVERILFQFQNSVNSIIRGIIITAFIQGVIAAIGFYIAGISSPVLLGTFVMFSALIPFLGTGTVSIPFIIYCYFTKPLIITVFIFIWLIFIVGLVDNFVRPILIGNYSKLPIGLVFLGIIGGIKSFGPPGIFIGPVFIAVFITLIDIYIKDKKSIS